MTALAIGIAVGMMIVCALLAAAVQFAGGGPSADPSDTVMDYELTHEMLFEPRRWARSTGTPAVDFPVYNRPLDIEGPGDAAILTPPRPIIGVNNEG